MRVGGYLGSPSTCSSKGHYYYQPCIPHTGYSCLHNMAFFRRGDVGQAFRNDRELQKFVLTDVTPTGRILGTGSFGSVEEVTISIIGYIIHMQCMYQP